MIRQKMRVPIATYRIQFNKGFRFEDARAIVPYLHDMGISDLYASPILRAREGSSHGYDVTDPSQLNPNLGSEEEFELLTDTLGAQDMGLLLDIVPNHMVASPENPWWQDLLENGELSPYAKYFDIDWHDADSAMQGKMLLPIIGTEFDQAIDDGELALMLEETGLSLRYHDYTLPLDIKSYATVLSLQSPDSEAPTQIKASQQLRRLVESMTVLPAPSQGDRLSITSGYQTRQVIKKRFLHLLEASTKLRSSVIENIRVFNRNRVKNDLLKKLIEQQAYRLEYWKTGLKRFNYRRFFNINELVGIRVEDPQVFEDTHTLIFELAGGKVTGLRIDHIDGLHDPLEYLRQLQYHLRSRVDVGSSLEFYVVVEKILSGDETLPGDWPVAGTTGYDFLNSVNTIFIAQDGIETLKNIYRRHLKIQSSYNDIVYEKKKQIIAQLFPGDIEALGLQLVDLALHDWATDIPQADLKEAIIEVISCLPVYRTYIRNFEVSSRDQLYLRHTIEDARRRNPQLDKSSLDFLDHVLLLDFPSGLPQERKESWLRFAMRCQQFTGAIMAKSLEDTTFYTYTPLLSLNDVGEDPGASGFSVEVFHAHNQEVSTHWPHTLNTTSTHDTKRGEDVRARLNVLSELPEEWEIHLNRWSRMNRSAKTIVDGQRAPDPNTEVSLYQTMLGAWPFLKTGVPEFRERLKAYMIKAVREGKTVSDWFAPNQDYEQALLLFINHLFRSKKFLNDFLPLQKKIAHHGVFNSLSQTLLKIASPGVPDFYQGTELWDLSMVDPDNRRSVDFIQRQRALDYIVACETQDRANLVHELLDSRHDGRIKLYVIYKALSARMSHRHLFQDGDYIPIQITGTRSENVCAFTRRFQDDWAIALAPRMLTKVISEDEFPLGEQVWKNSRLSLPEGSPLNWFHVFTGDVLETTDKSKDLSLDKVFDTFPIALLLGHI